MASGSKRNSAELQHNILIRPARAEDAPRLTILSAQLGYPVSQEGVARRLVDDILPRADQVLLVAETDGAVGSANYVVGMIHVVTRSLITNPLHAEIDGVVVDERCRGQNIGARLVEGAEAWAREQGCDLMYVRSNVIRADAHRFYQRHGYEVVKKQMVFHKDLSE